MQGNKMSGRITKSVLASSTAILMGMAVAGVSGVAPASAADTSASGEVVITGSRIARRDFTSNSPIVTVNSKSFENTSNVAVEATLNKLPQFTPDQNMTGGQNSGDVQPTANHSVGISTVSLRGLGPNRNLVLEDGRRLVPSNGELIVDVNSIPSAMIDHVEVITGGASAVYGADAVAGVVNFVMKKNFQGLDVDAQYGITQAGDGQEFKASAFMGANFADDKGNVSFGLEHYTRAPSLQANRDFYTKGWADPNTPTNEFFATGNSFQPDATNGPSQAAVSSLFTHGFVPATNQAYYFNNDGTVYTGAANAFVPGLAGAAGTYRYNGPVDGKTVTLQNTFDVFNGVVTPTAKVIKTTQTNNYVTAPVSRYSVYGDAHYDITPDLTAYIRGNFEASHTSTILFSTPFITGWAVNIPYDAATNGVASQHPVSAELATLLNSRTNPNAPWELQIIPAGTSWFPPRSTVDDTTVWQVTAGLKGNVPHTQFTWDLYGSHGQSQDYAQSNGAASLERYVALLSSPQYGMNQSLSSNAGSPNNGFGVATDHCTSGFGPTIFAGGSPSADCINAINATLQNRTLTTQNVVEFNVQGGLFNMPAGEVRASLGASYRDDSEIYNPDILQSTASFLDQVAGVYPTAYMNASTSAREGFGELLIPLLANMPLVKQLNLELGARYSTYTADDHLNNVHFNPQSGWTYKIQGDWAITDFARLRGGYNLAVRSPNLGELFLQNQEEYAQGAYTAYGDPCSLLSTAPFGANPATNPGGAANSKKICQGLMGGGTGAATYYGQIQAPGAATAFGFVNQDGNPNLTPEKAKTWTAGIVLSSPWHGPWVDGMRLSVDYYKIGITNAIETEAVDDVQSACLTQDASTPAALAAALASAACGKVLRNTGTGAQGPTGIQYKNLATINTSGIDVQLDWRIQFGDVGLNSIPGAIQLSALASRLNYLDTISSPGAPVQHWVGTLGPTLTGLNQGAFRYKTNTSLTYFEGPMSIGIDWRYVPHVHSASYGGTTASLAAPGATQDTKAFHDFDLSGTYTVMKNYTFRFGVDNLFDAQPPSTGIVNATFPISNGSDGQGSTNESLYDSLGRRFYVGLNAKF